MTTDLLSRSALYTGIRSTEHRAQNAKQDKHDLKRHDRHDKDINDGKNHRCPYHAHHAACDHAYPVNSYMSLSCLSCRLRSCLSCFAFCALYSESQLYSRKV